MARFFDIAAPPQSLEGLVPWGDLDSLPHSLDSAVWSRAGIYGFEGAVSGQSSQRLEARRISQAVGRFAALASGALRGNGLCELNLSGQARSGGSLALGCEYGVALSAPALGGGGLSFFRVKSAALEASALASGSCSGRLAAYLVMQGELGTAERLSLPRTLHLEGSGEAAAAGRFSALRSVPFRLAGQGRSSALLLLLPKGANWQASEKSGPTLWIHEISALRRHAQDSDKEYAWL